MRPAMISVWGGPFHKVRIGSKHIDSHVRGECAAGTVIRLGLGDTPAEGDPSYRLRHLLSLPTGPWLVAEYVEPSVQ